MFLKLLFIVCPVVLFALLDLGLIVGFPAFSTSFRFLWVAVRHDGALDTLRAFTIPKFAISQSEAKSNVLISYDVVVTDLISRDIMVTFK